MVETRRLRKRRAPENCDDEDAAASDLALEKASKMRSQKAKQRKIEAHARKPPFESLLPEILHTVFLFLDQTRDVYSLAHCSKYLRSIVTPEIVVRSAIFSGGKIKEAIHVVMNAVKKRSIHVPSTLRLLRLVNGKRCERLDECFAHDLVKNVPATCPKSGNRPFGLMICPMCQG
jgi:hypothetical protein